jgi:hypothetical protein
MVEETRTSSTPVNNHCNLYSPSRDVCVIPRDPSDQTRIESGSEFFVPCNHSDEGRCDIQRQYNDALAANAS